MAPLERDLSEDRTCHGKFVALMYSEDEDSPVKAVLVFFAVPLEEEEAITFQEI